MGAIPLYKPTLRILYSEVFNQDRFQFQLSADILKQKQWIWETTNPGPDITETVYATRAAQMSAVSEDRMRVIDEYIDFLLNTLPETIPDEVEDWIPIYYANTAMFLIEIFSGETAEYTEALLEKAVGLDPYNPMVRNNFATYFQLIGEPEKSLEHYEVALSVSPEWAELRNTYAATLDDLGEVTEAQKQYEKAIQSSQPQPQAHFNLASLMADLGQFEEAKHHYEKALLSGYHVPELYSNLGVLHTKSGDYIEGIRIMEEGLEVSESDIMLRINLATSYLDIERPDEAVDILKPMLDDESDSRVHGLLSYAYSNLGAREKAVHHGERAKDTESGQNPLEEEYLEDLEVNDVRDDPDWEEKPDLFRVFYFLASEENYSKAWEKGNEVLETGYDSSEFRRMLADVAEILNLTEDAEHHHEKAIQLDPEDGLAHHHYGNFLKHQGRLDEAEKRFKEGLKVSDNPEIYTDYGLLLLKIGDYEEAVEVLSLCLERFQQAEDTVIGEAQIHHNYAQALFHHGSEELARKHYERAIELRTEYPEPRVGLGQLETEAGNIDTGVEYLEEGMRLLAQDGQIEKWKDTLRLAIDILENAGRNQDAIDKCEYGINTLLDIGGSHLPIFGALQQRKSGLEK
ncbi:tetratricopeptide repeat protein [Salarchaeum japonicum]|uniref:tetratricopeptide repeat protein n=1 Tax=Salarchaeum japonicum TaxID=555573 RepID=UPI003C7379EC